MSSDSDDSDSDFAPGLRLFAVRGSRSGDATRAPAPALAPSPQKQPKPGTPELPAPEPALPACSPPRQQQATLPAYFASTPPSAAAAGAADELQKLQQKVQQLEAMNSSPPPAVPPLAPAPGPASPAVPAPSPARSTGGGDPASQIASLAVQLDAARTAAAQLQLELSAKEAEIEAEREQHETNSRKALKILQAKDEQLQDSAAGSAADAALVSELRDEVASLNEAVRDQEEQLAKARQENDVLHDQARTAVAEAGTAQAEADSAADDAAWQRTVIEDLEQQLSEATSANESLQGELQRAAKDRLAADAQLVDSAGRERVVADLTQALEREAAAREQLAESAEQHRQQISDQVAADHVIHQATLKEKDDRIGQLEAQLDEFEPTIATLRALGEQQAAPLAAEEPVAAQPTTVSPTTHDKRLTAMEELLSMDVGEEASPLALAPAVAPEPAVAAAPGNENVLADLTEALSREAAAKAELDEAVESQAKIESLLQRMDTERDGLYAEIDEARAAAMHMEDDLKGERESWRLEKLGMGSQLSHALEDLNGIKAAAGLEPGAGEAEAKERSPRFQELTNLAADDAMFQMQVKELEDELQAAHRQLAERRDEVKKLQAKVERLERSGAREVTRERQADSYKDQSLAEKEKELGRAKQKLRLAAEENTRLNERIQKLERLQDMAKSSALKAEKELESLRDAARDAAKRQKSNIASWTRQQEQLERRLEAAETVHDGTRAELAAKDSEIRELQSLGDASPTSTAEDRLERFEGDTARKAHAADDGPAAASDWCTKEESYRTEISSLKHEVHQVRIKLRQSVGFKSTKEHELEETVKRLGRRSKLHEGVSELSSQLAQSQAETNRMRIEVESLQLEKDHVKGELHRKNDRIGQLESTLNSGSQNDAMEQAQRRVDSLMDENRQLDDLLQAAQREFEERSAQDRHRDVQLEVLKTVRQQLKDKQTELLTQQLSEESNQEVIVSLEQSCNELRSQLSESQRRLFVSQQEAATRSTADASRHAKEVCAAEQGSRERDSTVQSLQKQLKSMSAEMRQLKAALEAAEEAVVRHSAECEERVANAGEETNRIRREACQCVSENEQLHSIIEQKSKQLVLLQESFDIVRDSNDETVQQQVVLLIAHLDDANSAHSELERRLADMQGALQGQVIDFTALQREAAAMLTKLSTANTDLTTAHKMSRAHEKEMRTMRLDFASMQCELEEAQHELHSQVQRSITTDEQLASVQAELVNQAQQHAEKSTAVAADHDQALQAFKLQILELEHEADSRLPISTVDANGPGSELLSELKGISSQVRECCTGIAEPGTKDKDMWCSRVDAVLDAYEASILNQSKQLGASMLKNNTLLTEVQCTAHTTASMQAQLQETNSKHRVMTSKVDMLQNQLDGIKFEDKAARATLAEAMQGKIDALTAELAAAKLASISNESVNDGLATDLETLKQQLAKAQRDLAVASTGKAEFSGMQGGDTEERVSRLREFFEAEVARLVTVPDDSERLREMSQQLAASKIMEDDLRMNVFAMEQQKDVLLTDAVVLKDVIRALEADLTDMQASYNESATPDATSMPSARALEYQTTIAELRTDAEVERQRATQLKAKVSRVEAQLTQTEEESTALKQEVALKIQQTHEEMQKARQEELAGVHKDHFEHKTKQAEEIFAMQGELQQLKASQPAARSAVETSISQSVTSTSLVLSEDQLNMDLDSTRQELTQLAAQNADLVDQLSETRAELSASTAAITDLESALNTLGQSGKKKDGKKGQVNKAWNTPKGGSDSVASMGRKYAAAQANLANVKRQLRVSEKTESKLQRQLHERDVHIEKFAAQVIQEGPALEPELEPNLDSERPKAFSDDGAQEPDQELLQQLAKAETSAKESADRVKVLTQAVEQLSTQLNQGKPQQQQPSKLPGRGGPRKSSGYGMSHPEKSANSTKSAKAIEMSQRMVIDKLREEADSLREQLYEVQRTSISASQSAEEYESCFGGMQAVVLSVAGIAPLLALITPKGTIELTETETIIHNISVEFGNLRRACDGFASLGTSPSRVRSTLAQPEPDASGAGTEPSGNTLAAGVQRELLRTVWDVINYRGRTLYGHEVNSLPEFFSAVDKASSGMVSRTELREACTRLDIGLEPVQMDRLVATIDTDADEGISFDEFESWMNMEKHDTATAAPQTPQRDRSQLQQVSGTPAPPTPSRAMAALKHKVGELESEVSELSTVHEKVLRLLQEGSIRYDNLSTDHRQAQRKLENMEALRGELQESAKSQGAIVAELKLSKRQLLKRVEQLQAALVQFEETSPKPDVQAANWKAEQEKIRQLESELTEQKADAEDTVAMLRMEAAQAADELRKAATAAEGEVERLQEQVKEAAATAAGMTVSEREQLSQQLDGVEHAMALKEAEVEGAVERIAAMQGAYDELQTELLAAEERYAEAEEAAQDELLVGEDEVAGLRAQLEAAEAQLEGARAECGSLRKFLDQKEKKKGGKKKETPQLSAAPPTVAEDPGDQRIPEMAKSIETLTTQKSELQELLEDAETGRREQAAQRVVVESDLRKASAKAEKWKSRQKVAERKLKESRAEYMGLREQLRGASEKIAAAKKASDKAVIAKGKQGKTEHEALRTENLRKQGVIEDLRKADGEHVAEKVALAERVETAEMKGKSLTKELARRVESVTQVRAHSVAAKALAEEKTVEQEASEQRIKDLVASNGRKDVSARTLKLRIEELQGEVAALRQGHSEAAEALVAEAEAAKKEAAKVAKADLARKEERIQLLLAKVSELSATVGKKDRSGGTASKELKWLRGAVQRTLTQLTAENTKLRLRLPLGASEGRAGTMHGEVDALSTSVLSDLLGEASDSDAEGGNVLIGGYRSESDVPMLSAANPHHGQALVRRSANDPVPKAVLGETEPNALADEDATAGGAAARKGKAPRAGEVKKWLAQLVDGLGGVEEKLVAATVAMGAAGQQGHGGVRCVLRCVLRPSTVSLTLSVCCSWKSWCHCWWTSGSLLSELSSRPLRSALLPVVARCRVTVASALVRDMVLRLNSKI